jgi:hypothetical protein
MPEDRKLYTEPSVVDQRIRFADGTEVLYPAGTPADQLPTMPNDLHKATLAAQREKSRKSREQRGSEVLARLQEARQRDAFYREIAREEVAE